jgi:anaerobic selenocysteine-containing dehydrogenase
MNPRAVSIAHGWGGEYNVNHLVGDDLFDAIAGTPAYKAVPCRLEKAPQLQ